MSTTVKKHHRYFVFDPDGRFISEWTDHASSFEITDEINSLGGTLTVRLARALRQQTVQLETLTAEDNTVLTTEDDQSLVAETTATVTVGGGTDVAIGNILQVYEYYGSLEELTTEDDQVLTTENNEEILVEKGPVDGRRVFYGEIIGYRPYTLSDSKGIEVDAVPLAVDLQRIMFENFFYNFNSTLTATTTDVAGLVDEAAAGFNRFAAETFVFTGTTGNFLRFLLDVQHPDNRHLFGIVTLRMKLYQGLPNDAGRTLLYTLDTAIDMTKVDAVQRISRQVDNGPELASGVTYHMEFSAPGTVLIGGFAPIYLWAVTPSAYSGGSMWLWNGTSFTEYPDYDIKFRIEQLDRVETKGSFASWANTTALFRTLVMYSQDRGGRIGGSRFLGADPGSPSPLYFNVNTFKDLHDSLIRLSPPGYYYRYDHTENELVMGERSSRPDHVFVIGRHLQSVDIEYDSRRIVNTIYFTGGETSPGVNFYKKYTDADSIAAYGARAKGMSDMRVTDPISAATLATYEMAASKDPVYLTTVSVLDVVYDTGSIHVGQTVGFNGAGSFIDDLVLQVTRKQVKKGKVTLTLGSLPQTERRRLAEMKQAVDRLEVKYNASTPS